MESNGLLFWGRMSDFLGSALHDADHPYRDKQMKMMCMRQCVSRLDNLCKCNAATSPSTETDACSRPHPLSDISHNY